MWNGMGAGSAAVGVQSGSHNKIVEEKSLCLAHAHSKALSAICPRQFLDHSTKFLCCGSATMFPTERGQCLMLEDVGPMSVPVLRLWDSRPVASSFELQNSILSPHTGCCSFHVLALESGLRSRTHLDLFLFLHFQHPVSLQVYRWFNCRGTLAATLLGQILLIIHICT